MRQVHDKYGNCSGWFSGAMSENELNNRTIPQLLALCMYKRRTKHPFKAVLVKYLSDCGDNI